MPEGAIHVARPSRWGNLWSIGGMAHIETCPSATGPVCFTVTRESAVALFRIYVESRVLFEHGWLDPLRGHDLACWCPLCEAHRDGLPLGVACADCAPCHGDVLLTLANA